MKSALDRLLWQNYAEDKPLPLRIAVYVARLCVAVIRDVTDGFLSLRATSLVYTTLLSLAPLLAISFAVLKGFGVHNQTEPFLREFLRPLGAQGVDIATRIVEFVDNIQVGVLGAVGVGLLIYSVISLMHKIEVSFNEIWNVPSSRPFVMRVRDYLGVLMIGPLFMFLSVGMTTSFQHAELLQRWFGVDLVNTAYDGVLLLLPYLLFTLAFTVLYMFMPNCKVRFLPALAAGALTAILWKTLGMLFGVFVTGSASYAAIYSAFAALILFIFWLYVGWLVLLIGASVGYYLQYPSNQRLPRRAGFMGAQAREKMALIVISEIGRVFYAGEAALTVQQLSRRMRAPAMSVEDVVNDLASAGIITVTGNDRLQYVPARPFDTTSVFDMLAAFRAAGDKRAAGLDDVRISPVAERILELSDKASRVVLGNITLKQLSLGEVST